MQDSYACGTKRSIKPPTSNALIRLQGIKPPSQNAEHQAPNVQYATRRLTTTLQQHLNAQN